MSIWGRRVDGWFDQRTATREDINRAGLASLWQIALVVLIAVGVVAIAALIGL